MNFEIINHRQAEEILNSKLSLFKEIKATIHSLTLTPFQKKDHDQIKGALRKKGWRAR